MKESYFRGIKRAMFGDACSVCGLKFFVIKKHKCKYANMKLEATTSTCASRDRGDRPDSERPLRTADLGKPDSASGRKPEPDPADQGGDAL